MNIFLSSPHVSDLKDFLSADLGGYMLKALLCVVNRKHLIKVLYEKLSIKNQKKEWDGERL